MPSNHSAGIGHALGLSPGVLGHQQESRRFDRIRGDDKDLGLDPPFFLCSTGAVVDVVDLSDARRSPSRTISLATVLFIIVTDLWFSASFKVMVGSYFAWIGQIGMHFVLPAQAGRFLYGCELRAGGTPRTGISVGGRDMPRNAVSAGLRFLSAFLTARSVSDSGIRGIG